MNYRVKEYWGPFFVAAFAAMLVVILGPTLWGWVASVTGLGAPEIIFRAALVTATVAVLLTMLPQKWELPENPAILIFFAFLGSAAMIMVAAERGIAASAVEGLLLKGYVVGVAFAGLGELADGFFIDQCKKHWPAILEYASDSPRKRLGATIIAELLFLLAAAKCVGETTRIFLAFYVLAAVFIRMPQPQSSSFLQQRKDELRNRWTRITFSTCTVGLLWAVWF